MTSDNEFMAYYAAAIERYTEEDFEAFFSLAGITDPETQSLGKDFLGAAGAFYLSKMERQADQIRRSDTIKNLNKAKKASRTLAESLNYALKDQSIVRELTELVPAIRSAYPAEEDRDRDSYKILDAIFPLSSKGEGFRYQGLTQALMMLASALEAIEADAIEKPNTGRSYALHPWMILLVFFWMRATQTIPRAGHYDSEVADYSSPAIAALTHAAQRLDPEISNRLIVQALSSAMASLEKSSLEGVLLMSAAFAYMLPSGETYSDSEVLRGYLGMPEDELKAFTEKVGLPTAAKQEKAIITREEFLETFKSSDFEKMLLQHSIERDHD